MITLDCILTPCGNIIDFSQINKIRKLASINTTSGFNNYSVESPEYAEPNTLIYLEANGASLLVDMTESYAKYNDYVKSNTSKYEILYKSLTNRVDQKKWRVYFRVITYYKMETNASRVFDKPKVYTIKSRYIYTSIWRYAYVNIVYR